MNGFPLKEPPLNHFFSRSALLPTASFYFLFPVFFWKNEKRSKASQQNERRKRSKHFFKHLKRNDMNITGRLTRNAELNTTKNGKEVVNFSIAVNDSYKNKQGERVVQTTYFNCAYWKSAKVLSMLTKGLLVELTGNVSTRAWIGTDGEAKASLNFHTSNIKPLAGGKKAEPIKVTTEPSNEVEKDDLPF